MGALTAQVERAETDASVRVIAVSGAGGNFSAGYDLTGFFENYEGASPQAIRDAISAGNELALRIWQLRKPVIAEIEGYCLGGAFEIAMACDFVMASSSAKFGEPEIRLADAPPFLISPWIMNMRAAKDLLLTGDVIDAQRADRLGLLTSVSEPAELGASVEKMARKLAGFAQETWHLNKSAVNRTYEIMGFRSAIEMGMDMFMAANTNPSAFKTEFVVRAKRDGFSSALKWAASRYEGADD
ncbi:MAG: enoyl-CoA hydratase/isomerase family protein [Proteobacteria bacterium]|nr:MAG: enoyl-CoA hydratase/isomerase family protein [Pseudomonadota bacterium]